jgi:hypothetical protein
LFPERTAETPARLILAVKRAKMRVPMTTDPSAAYSKLLEQRRIEIGALERQHRVFGYAKLTMAVVAAIMV